MLSEKEAYLSSVKKRLLQYEKAGVKLYLDGNPSDTDHIMKKCVKEDAAYMADYIADETGKVGAYIAAGSTITDDIPAMALSIARARQQNKKDWASKHKVKEK